MWTRSKRRYVDGRQLEFFWLSTTTNHKNPEIRMHSVSRLHFWSQSIPYYPTFILCHSFHISQTCDDPRALEWIFDWQGLTQKEFLVQSVGCISEVKVLHTIPTSSSFMLSIEISQTCDLIVLALIHYALQVRGGMLMNTAWNFVSINNHKLQTCLSILWFRV